MARNSPIRKPVTQSEISEFEAFPAARGSAGSYLERTSRNHFWVGGELGQKRIRDLKICVAGLGGIGGMIAETLARVGVGQLRITDLDKVDTSNINRQAMARKSTLGMNKAEAMARDLREIADDFELRVWKNGVHADMVEEFVDGASAIVDEIDVFALEQKRVLHRAARARGLSIYTAYAVGTGIHFYKFQGERYTVEDFLRSPDYDKNRRSGRYILDKIGYPLPSYLDTRQIQGFEALIDSGKAPIFGPTTLLGHALVSTRVLIDLLGSQIGSGRLPATPIMPEFLVLDAGSLEFRVCRMS